MGLQATWNRARDTGSLGSEQAGMAGESTQQDTQACTITDTHIYTHTHKVRLKNMIKNTVELITFPAISMSTHAEHLCPPPFIVLLWLILFSGMMIMISLAVKYKCKFTSILPDKPLGKRASLYSFGRRRGTFLKENTLNCRHYQFHSCHPPDFSHTLIHLFLCSIRHVDPSTPAAPLGTTVSYLLSLPETPAVAHPNMSKTSVGAFGVF